MNYINYCQRMCLVWLVLFHAALGAVHKLELSHKETLQALHANSLTTNSLTANALSTNALASNALTANAIIANGINANGINANGIFPNSLTNNAFTNNAFTNNALTSNSLGYNGLTGNALTHNAITLNAITHNAFTANALSFNDLQNNALAGNALTYNALTLNSLTYNALTQNALTQNALTQNAININALNNNALGTDTSAFPWATEISFPNLNFVRLVVKYASELNITVSPNSTTKWTMLNITVDALQGSELIGSMNALIENETYQIPLSGDDFTGMQWNYVNADVDGDWAFTSIRIDHVLNDSTGEIFFYALSTFNWTNGGWDSMCEKNGNVTEAIFLNHYWDVNVSRVDSPPAVTIACRHYALAKCVEWGYIPWKNATSCDADGTNCHTVSLQDYHQACTRMCRADYCGDGHGWTADGTLIDIWDNLTPPIQPRAEPKWPVEAEWNMDGAACVSGTRLTHWMKEGEPQCAQKPNLWQQPQCGSLVGSRSMLGTSFPPSPQKQTSPQDDNSSSQKLIKIIVPSVVVPLALIVAALIGYYFWNKSKKQQTTKDLKSLDPPTPTSTEFSNTTSTNV